MKKDDSKIFTGFILENNLWIHDKLDAPMPEKNILWEVTTTKYAVYKKNNIRASALFKCTLLQISFA